MKQKVLVRRGPRYPLCHRGGVGKDAAFYPEWRLEFIRRTTQAVVDDAGAGVGFLI
jgi:hypothetical protein